MQYTVPFWNTTVVCHRKIVWLTITGLLKSVIMACVPYEWPISAARKVHRFDYTPILLTGSSTRRLLIDDAYIPLLVSTSLLTGP